MGAGGGMGVGLGLLALLRARQSVIRSALSLSVAPSLFPSSPGQMDTISPFIPSLTDVSNISGPPDPCDRHILKVKI